MAEGGLVSSRAARGLAAGADMAAFKISVRERQPWRWDVR
jgi:hypothetical protein